MEINSSGTKKCGWSLRREINRTGFCQNDGIYPHDHSTGDRYPVMIKRWLCTEHSDQLIEEQGGR